MTHPSMFWRSVKQGGADECWPWQRALSREGYGRTQWNGKHEYAHRVACLLAHGPPPEGKPHALHDATRCSARSCCNPKHLRWGTHQENMADREVARRRHLCGTRT